MSHISCIFAYSISLVTQQDRRVIVGCWWMLVYHPKYCGVSFLKSMLPSLQQSQSKLQQYRELCCERILMGFRWPLRAWKGQQEKMQFRKHPKYGWASHLNYFKSCWTKIGKRNFHPICGLLVLSPFSRWSCFVCSSRALGYFSFQILHN